MKNILQGAPSILDQKLNRTDKEQGDSGFPASNRQEEATKAEPVSYQRKNSEKLIGFFFYFFYLLR